jgi:hypothetical protein
MHRPQTGSIGCGALKDRFGEMIEKKKKGFTYTVSRE